MTEHNPLSPARDSKPGYNRTVVTVRQRLDEVALERHLRASTRLAYQRSLIQIGVLDLEVAQVTQEQVLEALWLLSNPNTRRNAAIAARSVLGLPIKVPPSVPRHYDLPSEQDLRLALMTSPHEVRGLLMLYAGLRLGESCSITRQDLRGDRLYVHQQVQCLRETGRPTIIRLVPTKSRPAEVVIPHWLVERVRNITQVQAKPDGVRESLRRAGARVGFHLNPHMLRHAYCTMLLDRGVPITVVARQMRHSTVNLILAVYADHNVGQSIHDALG